MIRKLLLFAGITTLCTTGNAQDLLGLSTGNYTGVTGMNLNPASIVDSRLKFDLNLIGVSTYYSNNYLSVKRDALVDGSFFKSKYKDWSLVQRDLLQENRLSPGEKVNMRLNTRVIAPISFMLTTGKKSAIALNISNRTGVFVDNLNQDFARLAYRSFDDASFYGRNMDMSGINMHVLNWLDVGFTYGRVLLDQDKHFVKAAFTAKYMGGVASGYFQSDDLSLSFTDKNTVNATTPYAQYGHGEKLSLDMFKSATLRSLRPEAEGFGWNAGIVYEYRGKIDRFKYLSPEYEEKTRRDANKYAFRVGFSIMDAGRLFFKKSEMNNDFSAAITGWNLNGYNIRNISDVDTMLASRVNYLANGETEYSVSMPTAYSAQLDLHVGRGFYVNAMTYQPLSLFNSDRKTRVEAAYAVTPRFESRVFGIYLPVSYNEFDDWNVGASIRLGPVYFGSANLGSLAFNNKTKRADIHAGVRIPIAHGSPSKVAKLFDKISGEKEAVVIERVAADTLKPAAVITRDSTIIKKEAAFAALQTRVQELEKQRIIDSVKLTYHTQQPVAQQQPVSITINNYAGNSTAVKVDSVAAVKKDSAVAPVRVISDSASAKEREAYLRYINELSDEKEAQIDTLLNRLAEKEIRLQELEKAQKRIDSSYKVDTVEVKKVPEVKEEQEKKRPFRPFRLFQKKKKGDSDTTAVQYRTIDTLITNEAAAMQPLVYREEASKADSTYLALQEEVNELKKTIRSYNEVKDTVRTTTYADRSKELEAEVLRLRRDMERYNEGRTGSEVSVSDTRQLEAEVAKLRTELRSTPPANTQLNDTRRLENEVTRLRDELRIYANQKDRAVAYQPATERVVYVPQADNRRNNNPPIYINPPAVNITPNNTPAVAPVIVRDTVFKVQRDTVFVLDTTQKSNPVVRVDTVWAKDTVVQEVAKTTVLDNTVDNLLQMQLEKILFKVNQVSIQPSYNKTLQFIAENLKKYPELGLKIDGYTDKTGTPAINERLSLQRANAVKTYLLRQGVKEAQLEVSNHGANEPIAENASKTGQALNRRVELSFYKQ